MKYYYYGLSGEDDRGEIFVKVYYGSVEDAKLNAEILKNKERLVNVNLTIFTKNVKIKLYNFGNVYRNKTKDRDKNS